MYIITRTRRWIPSSKQLYSLCFVIDSSLLSSESDKLWKGFKADQF